GPIDRLEVRERMIDKGWVTNAKQSSGVIHTLCSKAVRRGWASRVEDKYIFVTREGAKASLSTPALTQVSSAAAGRRVGRPRRGRRRNPPSRAPPKPGWEYLVDALQGTKGLALEALVEKMLRAGWVTSVVPPKKMVQTLLFPLLRAGIVERAPNHV